MPRQIILKSSVVLFLLLALTAKGQDFIFQQETFGTEDGLPHREVNAIHQCSRGFIWVGTPQGLARFDGYHFERFNSRTDSLLHDNIWRILEDADGWFWLIPEASHEDFDIWHPVTRQRTTFSQRFGKNCSSSKVKPPQWITSANDQTILVDQDSNTLFSYHPDRGVSLIALEGAGLFDFNRENNFSRALIAADTSIWVYTSDNHLAELTWNGSIIQEVQLSSTPLKQFNAAFHSHSFPFVYTDWELNIAHENKKKTYLIDRDGNHEMLTKRYWIPTLLPTADVPGTEEDILIDVNSFYQLDGHHLFTLPTAIANEKEDIGSFRTMILSEKGDLWMGENFVLHKVSIRKNPFKHFLHNDPGGRKAIRGIFADKNLIVANVEHLGPAIINPGAPPTEPIPFEAFGHFAVYKLTNGQIVTGYARHLGVLSETGNMHAKYLTDADIWAIFQLNENTLWLGTDEGMRIFSLNEDKTLPFEKYNGFDDLSDALITFISKDTEDRIWICTNKGLFCAMEGEGVVAHFAKNRESPFRVPSDVIYHFYQDQHGAFWLASGGEGLIKLTVNHGRPEGGKVEQQYTTLTGLSNDVIYAVYPDDYGNFWLTSDQGLMQFKVESETVQTFLVEDGLPSNEFNRLAHFQSSDGQLYFGTIDGLITFHPKDLQSVEGQIDPPLRITNYEQFLGEESRMVERTSEILADRKITLQPDDRFFSISVALLNFENVQSTRYAYRFKGLEKDWNYSSEQVLRFGRLPYGNYELQIKAQDAKGHWSSNEILLPVRVLRPFYLQVWFIVLLLLMTVIGLVAFFKQRTRRLQKQKELLEKQVAERTETIRQQAEELKSLEQLKSRFFANVSHELRTPLTLMLGPVNTLLKREYWQEKDSRLLHFVNRNGKHLLKLVNEILDLSKMETGRLEVKETPVNFYQFLQPLVAQFSSFSDSESVRLQFDYRPDRHLAIFLDVNKFEKIVHNFLSNAIKFSPEKGQIHFRVEERPTELLIRIKDQGPGIHPDDLPYIFDRFYQSKQIDAPVQGGTGIGLSMCKELADLLGGSVWAESELGNGSSFYFRFPKKIVTDGVEVESVAESKLQVVKTATLPVLNATISSAEQSKTSILIVEDNPELRAYLQSILAEKYRVVTAENGKMAWALLLNEKAPAFDLIVSDLMMPVMDGFQLLEKVKAHATFRHLPFIMLTARADVRVKLRALRIGVDDYITKPFTEEELLVRMDNLLRNQQERMLARSEHQNGPPVNEPSPVATKVLSALHTQEQQEWLEKLEQTVIAQLGNLQLTAEFLAQEMAISRRQLYRRMKELTGLSINDYINEVRYQQARQMLEERTVASVKAAAYSVGLKDVTYFSRQFRKRFGKAPSEYL
ncbi:MAG: ATP-binding protein [Bacteroidota bacterium]